MRTHSSAFTGGARTGTTDNFVALRNRDAAAISLSDVSGEGALMVKTSRRVWMLLAAVLCVLSFDRGAAQAPHAQLLLVMDGLRPDYVTPELMPRLYALGQRGVWFEENHSVFPTVTRVNSSSLSTGAYPETHGLLGNTIYSERTFPTRGINTSEWEQLDAMFKAEGRLLTAPTLGAALQRAGKRFDVFSAGSSGSAMLLNHPVGNGAVINPEYIRPESLEAKVVAAIGKGPEEAVPNNVRTAWAVSAYLNLGLGELHSDVAAIWFGDPDATAHQQGVGTETTKRALKLIDEQIGRIEDTLRARGLLDRTNIIVTSDHGFSTHTGELKLAQLVAPFSKPMPDGTPDIVVTEGAVNVRTPKDPQRIAAIVAALQARPEVGAIFTRASAPGAVQGSVPGTLSLAVARGDHARAADILVSANWNGDTNAAGFAGKTTQAGVAGHGTSSRYDIHNTLIAVGPDFRERTRSRVPTSNVDIAPTILKLMGLEPLPSMAGRTLDEALRSGPAPASVAVTTRVLTSTRANGYQVSAHVSTVAGRDYLDYTEVTRTADAPR